MRNRQISDKLSNDEKAARPGNSFTYAVGLFITVSLLTLFGLTVLYSTSCNLAGTTYFLKQLMWSLVGASGACVIFLVGYKKISDYSIVFVFAAIVLLALADFCFPAVNGAHRWIKVPHLGNLQPSELAKLAVVLFLAKYCSDRMRYINNLSLRKGIIPAVMLCGVVLLLILKGKDLGTTVLLAVVMGLMLFAAGLRLAILVLPLAILLPGGILWIKSHDSERWSRMTSFVDPEMCQQSDGYQLWNSLLALGSGGWYGLGFMESRLKAKYLPEAHTDFILAIVGEELGYISLALIILAYLSLMYFAIRISLNAKNKLGMLLAFGVTMTIALQSIINMGVVSGAFPTKGMPAPFISYGGSNLLMCMMGVGILLSIAIDSAYPGLNEEIIDDFKGKLSRLFSPSQWF